MSRWIPVGLALLLAAGGISAVDRTTPDETGPLLKRIVAVGREGDGNVEAAAAWKTLVQKGVPAMTPILRAMKDDEPAAANWLRPAFEAIAEKALREGNLSKQTLEAFVAEKKHSGTARRLAYEWLVKVDRTAPDRLMPGMLLDPSPELRRDAVERVITSAKQAMDAKDDKAARARYQKALSGACDPDQVDTVVLALEKLGTKVDMQKHLGVVAQWQLIAPFDHTKGIGWDRAYPPEQGVDLTKTYKGKDGMEAKWTSTETKNVHGIVDLNKVLSQYKGAVCYAYAVVDSPREQVVELRAGCICGLKIWLNGEPTFAREEYHHGMRIDQYTAVGKLKAGRNTILLKVCQNEQKEAWAQKWQFQLRITDRTGVGISFTQPREAKP